MFIRLLLSIIISCGYHWNPSVILMVLPASPWCSKLGTLAVGRGETRSPRNGPWLGIDQTPATTGCIMVPVEPTEAADTAKVLFECAQNKDRFGESQAAFVPMHGCLDGKHAVFIACWHRYYLSIWKR